MNNLLRTPGKSKTHHRSVSSGNGKERSYRALPRRGLSSQRTKQRVRLTMEKAGKQTIMRVCDEVKPLASWPPPEGISFDPLTMKFMDLDDLECHQLLHVKMQPYFSVGANSTSSTASLFKQPATQGSSLVELRNGAMIISSEIRAKKSFLNRKSSLIHMGSMSSRSPAPQMPAHIGLSAVGSVGDLSSPKLKRGAFFGKMRPRNMSLGGASQGSHLSLNSNNRSGTLEINTQQIPFSQLFRIETSKGYQKVSLFFFAENDYDSTSGGKDAPDYFEAQFKADSSEAGFQFVINVLRQLHHVDSYISKLTEQFKENEKEGRVDLLSQSGQRQYQATLKNIRLHCDMAKMIYGPDSDEYYNSIEQLVECISSHGDEKEECKFWNDIIGERLLAPQPDPLDDARKHLKDNFVL